MKQLPTGYRARPACLSDAEAITDLLNTYMREASGEDAITAERLRGVLRAPGLDLATDSRLVFSKEEELVALAAVIAHPPYVRIQQMATVSHPKSGRGIGTALFDWMEERSRELLQGAPKGLRVVAMQSVHDGEQRARRFLEAQGFKVVRHFWRMMVDLEEPSADPLWPPGITVHTFDPECDLEAAFHAGREAFRDHWGHVDGPIEQELERFRHRVFVDPTFDPALWFLARDGEKIAGICFASAVMGTDETSGYIPTLAVRRPWRRRGLALAMLHHAFGELRHRGKRRVGLHVDSASPTGATRLYEKAGMRVDQLSLTYEKQLRAGTDTVATPRA